MKEAQDNELVKRVLAGERTVFKVLYVRYLPKVYEFSYWSVGNREDAENITSETFMKALTKLSWFKGSSFNAWLFAIARNEVAAYWRERYRAESLVQAIVLEKHASAEEFEADERRTSKIVAKVLEHLPKNYRRVLELRFLSGMSISETAKALGMTEGNVKVMQHRALKKAAEVGWIE